MHTKPKIIVLDYGTGNLSSVKRVFERLSVEVIVSSSPGDVETADKIVMPGVGHFDTAMAHLRKLDLIDALDRAVLIRRRPILGICLGMEVMAADSEEGRASGLGWLDAKAVRFSISDNTRFKVPHMGWNTLRCQRPSRLFDGIADDTEFYFAHAYHLELSDPEDELANTEYESLFPSAVQKDNIFGVQCHPEKSQDAGVRMLRNFVDLS
jgi:glutamine amidotransferase